MINKKGILALAIIAVLFILGWFVFRALDKPETVIENDSDPKVHSLNSMTPPSLKITKEDEAKAVKNGAIVEKSKVDASADENFEAFDKMEKAWLEKTLAIIGPEKHPLYLDMRTRNDQEKMQAYKEYHAYLRNKFGDKFAYNISEDQSAREKKINQRYFGDLLKLIGPEKFKQYTKARDEMNEQLRRNNLAAIQVDF